MHIFISYAKKDTPVVARQLRDALKVLPDVTVWMDESIEVGGSWPQQIQAQIDRCNLMVVLLSPDVNRDPNLPTGQSFVLTELNYALYEAHKPVVPVMVQKTRVPLQLAGVHYVDLTQNLNDGLAQVIEVVRKRAEVRPRSIDLLPPPFEWIEIPAGRVEIGDGLGMFDVPTFEIAKYPITNAQYAKFVEADGYNEKNWWTAAGWQARKQGWDWDTDHNWRPSGVFWVEPRYWKRNERNSASYPVVGVSWYEASAFCLWLSQTTKEKIMLPTEQQWQRAAQGDDNRKYPWGNKFDEKRCNFNTSGTTPVTWHLSGASLYGVIDMSGNVWEWCLSSYNSGSTSLDGTDIRIHRGGSWLDFEPEFFSVDFRGSGEPDARDDYVGFRIARTR